MKRAQVTTFAIVGILLLLLFVVLFFLASITNSDIDSPTVEFYPPERYIEFCVKDQIIALAKQITSQGGISEKETFRYLGNDYQFLYTPGEHSFETQQAITTYFDMRLPTLIRSCVNLSVYENEGYVVNAGEIQTTTTITKDTINSQVSYPITLVKGNIRYDPQRIDVRTQIPFGRILTTVHDIINHELEEQFFDQQRFMHQKENIFSDSFILTIYKYKPYPHTLYEVIAKDHALVFRFAIQGESTTDFTQTQGGCCNMQNACYKDVSEEQCLTNGGTYISDTACSCIEQNINELPINTNNLDTCQGIPSGQSFCEYDSGVGGRFYRKLCIDGELITESCRDFKQEVCAEQDSDSITYSKCRINTAQSCSSCTTQECCKQFDCQFTPAGVCVPKAGLGIPFWDTTFAQQFCTAQFAQLQTTSEPQVVCSLLGDCGTPYNYFGEFSQEVTPEFTQQITPLLQNSSGFAFIVENSAIEFPIQQEITFSQLFAQHILSLEELAQYNSEEFLDPLTNTPVNTQAQFCGAYNPPSSQLCSVCGQYGKPCTEYSCKSLGSQCQFRMQNGIPTCSIQETESQLLEVTRFTTAYPFQETALQSLEGYTVTQPLSTIKTVSFGFETNEPALCKPTYLPLQSFLDISSPDMSYGTPSLNHTLQIRFVNELPVFEKLLDRFDVPSYEALASEITEFAFQLDRLHQRYPFIPKYNPPFLPLIDSFVDAYLDEQKRPIIDKLLNQLNQKTYTVFISCRDTIGNELEETPYVTFSLISACEEAPTIESIKPDADPYTTETFTVYTDQLSECRFDIQDVSFFNMTNELECPISVYDLSQNGLYACEGQYNGTQRIFVKCAQQAPLPSFNITVYTNETSQITEIPLEQENVTVQLNSTLRIIFDEPYVCAATNLTIPCSLHACIINMSQPIDQILCKPRDANLCSTQLVQQTSTVFTPKKLTSFSLSSVSSQNGLLSVQTGIDRDIECYVESDTIQRAQFEQINSQLYQIQLPGTLTGDVVRISCSDEFGFVAQHVHVLE